MIAAGFFVSASFFAIARAATVGTAVTVTVVPNAPSSLTASASSQSEIDLSWTDNANNEDGFSVERSTDGVSFAAIATTSANVAVYADRGLSASTLYYYRVDAFNANGTSTYSNVASTTTPSVPIPPPGNNGNSGGGGGGGGGGAGGAATVVFPTAAVFRGIAYPLSNVTLIENGQVVAVTQSGPDAKFEVDLSGVAPGTYNFGVWATDPAGNRSITQTFQVSLTNGATTVISGIFFPPTISADKTQVKQGDVVTIIGYTAPQVAVTVMVHSTNPIVQNLTSTDAGVWTYALNTDLLALGAHTAVARAQAGNSATADSALISFTVGDQDVAAPKPQSAAPASDLNGDGRVNLIDFSIMAYWFGRPNPPPAVDLNHDGVVNLVDFSIMAYYWTG